MANNNHHYCLIVEGGFLFPDMRLVPKALGLMVRN